MNHQYPVIPHERLVPGSPDNGAHRSGHAFDDAFGRHRGVLDGGIDRHAVQHRTALRVDEHPDEGRTHDVLQKVERLAETPRALFRNAAEEADGGRTPCARLTDDMFKSFRVHLFLWVRIASLA